MCFSFGCVHLCLCMAELILWRSSYLVQTPYCHLNHQLFRYYHLSLCWWIKTQIKGIRLSRLHLTGDRLLPACMSYASRRQTRKSADQLDLVFRVEVDSFEKAVFKPWPGSIAWTSYRGGKKWNIKVNGFDAAYSTDFTSCFILARCTFLIPPCRCFVSHHFFFSWSPVLSLIVHHLFTRLSQFSFQPFS